MQENSIQRNVTMPEIKRVGELELNEDLDHHRREWKLERIAWISMGLIVLAALAGLLGNGFLSSTTAGNPGGDLWVEYNRFERREAPARMKIHFYSPPRREEGGGPSQDESGVF